MSIDTCYCNACRVAREKDAVIESLLAACRHALTIALEYDESGFAGTIVLKKMLREAIAKAEPDALSTSNQTVKP